MSAFAGLPSTPIDVALELAERGFVVFPCSPTTKRPYTRHGFKDASRDETQIAEWWSAHPRALIGLPTGELNGLWVLDIDSKHGSVDDILEEIETECDARFRGPRVLTLNHGRHVYFTHDPRVGTRANAFRPGVDWRGVGGYAIAPDGDRYQLLSDGEIEPAPDALIERIVAAQAHGRAQRVHESGLTLHYQPTLTELADGLKSHWHDSMIRLVMQLLMRGLSGEDILALAPLFQQPGFSLQDTQKDLKPAIVGGCQKLDKPLLRPLSSEEELPLAPFDWSAFQTLPPRRWIYGHWAARKFLSVIGAPGGVGKTAYAIACALAIAAGRPLLEERMPGRGRVALINLEDPLDEMQRRVGAAMMLHGVKPADIEDRLLLLSGRDYSLVVAERTKDGVVIATPVVDCLIAACREKAIDWIIADPFVKTHALEENRNEQVDFTATLWSFVADRAEVAVTLVHHFRKGGQSGDADAFRGASALVDAARAAISLAAMNETEAERFGVSREAASSKIRLDNAKLNIAPRPENARWLELVGVEIPSGDSVQAVRAWSPPSSFGQFSLEQCGLILDRIAAGLEGQPYTRARQSGKRWAGQVVLSTAAEFGTELSEGQAAAVILAWLKSGCLEEYEYSDPGRRERKGLRVNPAKRPGAE